ncbi:hypothetical protein L6452_43453 [Arctium lappa]|uniref:Uncharacterized protein n=1 Tax=Arctium lappa TaxID=4217 RepID=A0ACB8XCK6_ARCLA|nr:hypothetical protein L6452_43453 [Arctium lappa]
MVGVYVNRSGIGEEWNVMVMQAGRRQSRRWLEKVMIAVKEGCDIWVSMGDINRKIYCMGIDLGEGRFAPQGDGTMKVV